MSTSVGIHWFRKGLRLHDNKGLLTAVEKCSTLIPLYIIHEKDLSPKILGTNRLGFLLESLQCLDQELRNRGSGLVISQGDPLVVLEVFARHFKAQLLTFERDTEPYNKEVDEEIIKRANANNIEVGAFYGHTLFDPNHLLQLNDGKTPLTMADFLSIVEQAGLPEQPLTCPETVPPLPPDIAWSDVKIFANVPTVSDFEEYGYKGEKTSWLIGGEREALMRMEKFLSQRNRVLDFEKPKTNPTALEPDTTALSPYFTDGSLSVRLFYHRLREVLGPSPPVGSTPPVKLGDQLYWRELSYLIACTTPNFDRMLGNPICMQLPWINGSKAAPLIEKWESGKTGFPAVDAVMKQLVVDGWCHHLARHLVACFLSIGDLWVTWELGKSVLERYLIDQDYSINNFCWQWLSSSAYFEEFSKSYGPVSCFKHLDPTGTYIRKYLPVLKNYPDKYIYEPWTAPKNVQEEAECIIGKDYPKPMVDHSKASKDNMSKMKAAFAHAKDNGCVFFNAGYPNGVFFPKIEKKQAPLKLFGVKLNNPLYHSRKK